MPFIRYANYASFLLLALIIISVALPAGLPTWLGHIGSGLAVLIGLAFVLQLGLMIKDWQLERLFIVRNATFYTSLILIVALFFILGSREESSLFSPIGWWLAPLLLFQQTLRLSYVRLDAVRLDIKMGLNKLESIALFQLKALKIEEASVEAMLMDGRNYSIMSSYFSKNRWAILLAKLEQLRQKLDDA